MSASQKPSKRIPVKLPKPVSAEFEACPDPEASKSETFSVPDVTKTEVPSNHLSPANRPTLRPVSIRSKVLGNGPALSETSKVKPPVEQQTPRLFKLPELFTYEASKPLNAQVVWNFPPPAPEARKDSWAG